jgi:hypothetical protein
MVREPTPKIAPEVIPPFARFGDFSARVSRLTQRNMHPDLSVVLVVGERRDRAVRALASVLAQSAADRLEVLVPRAILWSPVLLLVQAHQRVRPLGPPGSR